MGREVQGMLGFLLPCLGSGEGLVVGEFALVVVGELFLASHGRDSNIIAKKL